MGPVVARAMGQERLYFTSTQLHCAHTMLPLAPQCRFTEALHMEQAIRLMERLPRIVPLAARVDGIYWTTDCPESAAELHEIAAEHRYSISQRPVYKMKDCRMDKMPVNAQSFEYKAVPLHQTAPWTHRQELGAEEMLANGGALVTGAAGTGKSYLLHRPKELEPDALVCAYTHVAAMLIGGHTVAHALLASNTWDKWIFVDEVSPLPLDALGNLAHLTLCGAKFVLFGDYDGQFESVADRWTVSSGRLQQPQLLRDMVKSLWVRLTTYRRGDDEFLFDFYHGLYESKESVREMVARARKSFPACSDPDLVLCISHNKRILINKRMNETKAPDNAVRVYAVEEIQGTTCQPQDMLLWPKIELIGCPRGRAKKYGVVQGVVYTLLYIGPLSVLRMRPEYGDDEIEVPLGEIPYLLGLTHAMCYYTIQGRTIRDKHIQLIDTDHPNFSRRALIVGLSRAAHCQDVHVGESEDWSDK